MKDNREIFDIEYAEESDDSLEYDERRITNVSDSLFRSGSNVAEMQFLSLLEKKMRENGISEKSQDEVTAFVVPLLAYGARSRRGGENINLLTTEKTNEQGRGEERR